MRSLRREDEEFRRRRLALLVAGVAFALIALDISGIASTVLERTETSTTAVSTIYVTQTVTNTENQAESTAKTQTTSQTTSHTPSSNNAGTHLSHTTTNVSTVIRSTSVVTPTINRLENWMLFVSLDPPPSFTSSGVWRVNQSAVGVLLVLVGNFSTHLVPYRAVLNLTIKGPGIDVTFRREELPLNGSIEGRTTAYELTLNRVKTPEDASYLVSVFFRREDGAVLRALGWDRVTDRVYREVRPTLRGNPPWEG